MSKRAEFWIVVSYAIVMTLLGAAVVKMQYDQSKEDDKRCMVTVQARADNRAMWVYLLGQSVANEPHTPEEEQRIEQFSKELDRRLPSLTCDGGTPVEVEENDNG